MKYVNVEDFCFSLVQGGSFYGFLGDEEKNPTQGLNEENAVCPVLCDSTSGEKFFAKRLRYFDDDMNFKDITIHKHYIKLVKNPPKSPFIIWPYDIIEYNDRLLNYYKSINGTRIPLYLVQHQNIYSSDIDNDPSGFGLLFSVEDVQGLKGLYNTIMEYKQESKLDYNNEYIRHIIVQLVQRISEFAEAGYIFYDFDFSRFMVDSRGNLYINFSNHLFHQSEYEKLLAGSQYLEEPQELALDFIEPAFGHYNNSITYADKTRPGKEIRVPDYRTMEYGLDAMIFYLMFGQYAYEGGQYEIRSELVDLSVRLEMCMDHIRIPKFIFDPKDRINAISNITEEDEKLQDLWDKCPENIKTHFIDVLCEGYAKRETDKLTYPKWSWKEVLGAMGWK